MLDFHNFLILSPFLLRCFTVSERMRETSNTCAQEPQADLVAGLHWDCGAVSPAVVTFLLHFIQRVVLLNPTHPDFENYQK